MSAILPPNKLEEDDAAELREKWACWMAAVAHEGAADKVREQLRHSERLLASGFSEAAIVMALTALEILGSEIVVESLFGGLLWTLGDFVDHMVDSIFGRNGRLQNLRTILEKGFGKSFHIPADVWATLEQGQRLRNLIVHRGERDSQGLASRVIKAVQEAVDHVLGFAESASKPRTEKILREILRRPRSAQSDES